MNAAAAILLQQLREDALRPRFLAIDGRCGAGKSTLARWLQETTGCNLISMDHFYLPLSQRTPERMAQPGGHIHWERLLREVLRPLSGGKAAAYRPYDCHGNRYLEEVTLDPLSATLVEGTYSCLPELWPFYAVHAFLTIDPERQLQRLTARNGAEGLAAFQEIWIPREEAYFQAHQISARCEYCFSC